MPAGETVQSKLEEKIKILKSDDERTKLSKRLTFVVRRGADRYGVKKEDDGFMSLSEIIKLQIEDAPVFEKVTEAQLWSLAKESNTDKKRYELKEDGNKKLIKASDRTSAKTDAEKPKRKSKGKGKGTPGAPNAPQDLTDEQLAKVVQDFLKATPLDDMARERLMKLDPKNRHAVVTNFKPKVSLDKTADLSRMFCTFCKKYSGEPQTPAAKPVTLSLYADTNHFHMPKASGATSLRVDAQEFKPMPVHMQHQLNQMVQQTQMAALMQQSYYQGAPYMGTKSFAPPSRMHKSKKASKAGKDAQTDGATVDAQKGSAAAAQEATAKTDEQA
jgi:uncharacterized protein YlaN (UPF0358 family)